ncbi:hypothetical protein LSTR_LSTR011891 [Laodelphax striatellus]|uniref:C2H2-type domain-containing protein n=1 Tax=Laodelphax striatellus TaxID=195883 RepID=A0A482WVF2_LAOST|nr:hypothetical protein LSTR_LSTR011891 [Laodelphax striatellus]
MYRGNAANRKMHLLIEGTQTNNSAKSNMQNENMKVTNNSTSQISSAGGKIAVNESKHPTSKEDDRLSSEKSIKATGAIDSETGSSKSLDGDFVSFNTPDSATKTLENLGESPTNSSKKVALCEGDTESNSDQVTKSKNIKSAADFFGKITNTNFEYKESVGITDLNLSYNLESKPTFDTNVKTVSKTDSNKTDLTNSLENVSKKREIANRTIRNKPLSAREILKKSIEIRGKRLERIAVSQNLEEVASKENVGLLEGKSDAKDENIGLVENIVKVTSTNEENPSETKTVGLNTSQNNEGGDKNVLEVNKIERGKVEENKGTKNTEVLGESAIEGDGSIGGTCVNVVKQNFHKDFQENSGEKSSEPSLPTSDFIENADKIVENEPVNIRKGKSGKRSNISRNLVERNVGSSLGEDTKNCGEEDSASLQTRRLRKRTAPQQSSSSVHENLVIQEEKGEKNSSGGKLLRKASKGRRKTAAEVNSTQSFDTNECQSTKKLSNELKLEYQSSEKLSTEFGEKNHLEEAEIFENQSSNALETSRKSSQLGSRKLRNKTAYQISENFGEFEENFDTKEENIEDLNAKSVESSEKALSGSSKVKRKRGRPKAVSKVIGRVDNRLNSCKLSNLSNGNKLPNIDDLLRDVLENLTKSSTEKVNNMPKSSADSVNNLTKNSEEEVENISKHFAENAKNSPTTSAKDLEKCVASIENAVAVKKKKVGRPKRVGKNHEVRKLLESASFNAAADVFEEFDNCGVADVNRLEPVARRLRKRCRSTGNSTKYVESDSENSGGKSENPLESDGENLEKPLANSVGNSEKHLENVIVMLADGPKTTLDPQVQLLNEMMSGNKSKTMENRDLEPQSSATYCTNNLSEDGLRMIIKKEINNSLENKNSSPEIYEEDIFEYGNVIHKARKVHRKEKIKQEEAISDDRSDTNHAKNIGDNGADEIINNQLIQAIKEEPNDNAEELLLENEGNETREYTINNLDQKEKLEEKPFANRQETIRFRTRSRGGRRSYLIPKSVDISGYVNRCKQTTADNKIDKKYDKNIHGNYTMEIKSEIADAENNNFISNLVGVAKRARRSRRVRRRVRVSDRILDGTKMSKNKVENSVNALDSSENSDSALENHVESVRNSTVDVDGVSNSTDKVGSVRNSTDKVESVRNSKDKVDSVRNSTDNVESHRNSTDIVQSARNNIDNVESLRNSTVDAESVENSINAAGNVQSSLNYVENVKNSINDVGNCTNDFESVKNRINATGNVENSLNDSEIAKNSTEVVGNVENSTVTTSTGPNKILVKSLASLMNNFGSNHGNNGENSAGPSKSPSNRLLVRNLANLVSKLDSIARNDVKNLEETGCKADLYNDNVKLEATNTVPIDFDTVSNGGRHTVSNIDRDSVSNIESNTVSNRLHSKSNRRLNFDTVSNTEPNIASNSVSNRHVSVSNRGLNSDTVSNIASNTVSNRLQSVSNRGLNFDTVSTTDPNFEPADYDEEKYSALLEANRLMTVADDEFMKTIESFLDQEVKNSGDGVGKKVRKKRRRPCELPALPESLKCETCGKVLKNRQSFEYHKTTHTDPKKQWMKCSCCQKLLAGERRLKSHMQNYHTLVKTYSCDRCKKIFHSRGNLYRHIVNVHLEPDTYTCDIGKKSFKKKSYLAQHINMHMGIRRHECNLCGKNFMNRTDLQNHLDAHVGFDRYVCGVCGKRLTSMQAMHVHMKYHTGENMFRCKYCEKEYATKSSLKEHMNVHTGKKYTCDTCGAQFSYRNGYKRHLQTHEGKQQECDICHKVFQRKCYLKKHMTIHMGTEQFMCVYCGKKFIEKSDYNIHVNRHTHAEKFPCEFCGKVFHNKGYLVDHRKMHTGDTKHVCKYCGKKFMKRGLLERHESIHEGTNFVKCDLCGAMLSSVNSCRRHLRGVHGVVL